MRLLSFITFFIALPLIAQQPPEIFDIEGHKAVLYAAPKPAETKPWVWYAPTLRAYPAKG